MNERRYAIVRQHDKIVDNVVMWDGDRDWWSPPPGCDMVLSEVASPGDFYDGVAFRTPDAQIPRAPDELSGVTRIVTRTPPE